MKMGERLVGLDSCRSEMMDGTLLVVCTYASKHAQRGEMEGEKRHKRTEKSRSRLLADQCAGTGSSNFAHYYVQGHTCARCRPLMIQRQGANSAGSQHWGRAHKPVAAQVASRKHGNSN
jgi:hypothetical protein